MDFKRKFHPLNDNSVFQEYTFFSKYKLTFGVVILNIFAIIMLIVITILTLILIVPTLGGSLLVYFGFFGLCILLAIINKANKNKYKTDEEKYLYEYLSTTDTLSKEMILRIVKYLNQDKRTYKVYEFQIITRLFAVLSKLETFTTLEHNLYNDLLDEYTILYRHKSYSENNDNKELRKEIRKEQRHLMKDDKNLDKKLNKEYKASSNQQIKAMKLKLKLDNMALKEKYKQEQLAKQQEIKAMKEQLKLDNIALKEKYKQEQLVKKQEHEELLNKNKNKQEYKDKARTNVYQRRQAKKTETAV